MAAAAGLVWATLLMCVALGAGQVELPPTIASLLFPAGSQPEPVRLYCREDAALNVAVREWDNKVVLAIGDCKDPLQKWIPLYKPFSLNDPAQLKPFSLMNFKTGQVITIPFSSGEKVGLMPGPPSDPSLAPEWVDAVLQNLWTPDQPRLEDDRFYQLFVTPKDRDLTLNALDGVHVGMELGIHFASPGSRNAIWQLTSFPPPCGP
ncbi:hypothetical protein ACQJBY_065971 [Aegilops geniculata]